MKWKDIEPGHLSIIPEYRTSHGPFLKTILKLIDMTKGYSHNNRMVRSDNCFKRMRVK